MNTENEGEKARRRCARRGSAPPSLAILGMHGGVMTPGSTQSVTDLLQARASRVVYDDLRRQARRYMRAQPAGHTLQTTALGHEAYLRLVGQSSVERKGRAHFFDGRAGRLTGDGQARVDHRAGLAPVQAECRLERTVRV